MGISNSCENQQKINFICVGIWFRINPFRQSVTYVDFNQYIYLQPFQNRNHGHYVIRLIESEHNV